MRLIAGLVTLAALYFGWNLMHPGIQQVSQTGNGPLVAIMIPNADHIPLRVLFGSFFTWYLFCFINIVDQRVRRPVMRFGKYVRTLDAGLNFLEPIVHDTLRDVSVQDVVIEVEVDDMQTKDNVGISIKGLLTYRIDENQVQAAVVEVEDVDKSVNERALSTLADVGATRDLDTLLEHRDQFCIDIKAKLSERITSWGIAVQAFELQEFRINDGEVEKAIAMKARARKEGEAELVRASMQTQIAKSLNEAAELYTENGRWLKGVETLTELCRSGNNNTILVPTDLTESLARVHPLLPK